MCVLLAMLISAQTRSTEAFILSAQKAFYIWMPTIASAIYFVDRYGLLASRLLEYGKILRKKEWIPNIHFLDYSIYGWQMTISGRIYEPHKLYPQSYFVFKVEKKI